MKALVAAALIAFTSCAHALEIPDTPAGHALAMWVNAVNSGDENGSRHPSPFQ